MNAYTALNVVVLAAGEGSRMKSAKPKPLHKVGGLSLLGHALRAVDGFESARITVVTGAGGEAVTAAAKAFDPDAGIAVQAERLGTGHAVLAAKDALATGGEALVLYADTPFIRPETIEEMLAARALGADQRQTVGTERLAQGDVVVAHLRGAPVSRRAALLGS